MKGRTESDLALLRETYRDSLPERAAGCPDEARLAELVTGELEGDERSAVADHLVGCRACADAYRDLLELDREAFSLGAADTSPAARRLPRWALPLAAGLAALAIGAAVLLLRAGDRLVSDPTTLRSTGAVEAVDPPPGAFLDAAPRALRWTLAAGESASRVQLFDAGAELLWETRDVAEGTVELPPGVRAAAAAAGSCFWVVEVSAPGRPGAAGGERRGPFWFRIERDRR